MEGIRERTVVVEGLRMHCLVAGEGPLLVLLHGWPQTSHCWRRLIGPLGGDYTVVAPDLPTHAMWRRMDVKLARRYWLRAGFDDYRASFPTDDADAAAGRRLAMPVLVLWGASGLFGQLPALEIWRGYAEDVTGAGIPDCGHFLAEEQPEAVLRELDAFLPRRSAGG